MKAGFILAFFVLSTLVFIAADNNDREQVKIELSADQFGIVPDVGFSEKLSNSSTRLFFRLMIESYFGNPCSKENKIASTYYKSYLDKTIDLIPGKHKPFRRIIIYTSDKQDSSSLS